MDGARNTKGKHLPLGLVVSPTCVLVENVVARKPALLEGFHHEQQRPFVIGR
jgi:hypothetical protein